MRQNLKIFSILTDIEKDYNFDFDESGKYS